MRTSKYFKKNPFAKYALSRSAAAKYMPRAGQVGRILASTSNRRRAEIKTVDGKNGSTFVTLPINTTGNVQPVNLIQAGTEFWNRIGRRIEMQSIHLTGVVQETGNEPNAMDYGRIAIVYDRQPNGALPTAQTIFAQYDQSGTSSSCSASGVNPDQRERFVVLADERLALPSVGGVAAFNASVTGATDGSVTTFRINRFLKLRGLKTHYQSDQNPATIAGISSGALYVVTYGAINAGGEGWQFQGDWRLRFSDT